MTQRKSGKSIWEMRQKEKRAFWSYPYCEEKKKGTHEKEPGPLVDVQKEKKEKKKGSSSL